MTKVKVQQEWTKEDTQDFMNDFFSIGHDKGKSLYKIYSEQYDKWIEKGYTRHQAIERASAVESFFEDFIKEHLTD